MTQAGWAWSQYTRAASATPLLRGRAPVFRGARIPRPAMSHELPPTIDPAAALRWQQAAPAASPWLHEEVARRMQERLDWIVKPPQRWCHWQPVRGGLQAHALLRQRYAQSECLVYEASPLHEAAAREQLGARWWQPARWTGGATRFREPEPAGVEDRKSTRLNSSHLVISYAVFCLKKKKI